MPICTLFITLLAVIMWTGDVRTNGIGGAFMNCQVVLAITTGFITASVAAGIMGAKAGLFNFKDIVGNFSTGVSQQTDVIMILVLAWSMGSLTGMMDLKGYLVHIVEATNLNPGLMPALIFIVGAFVGFSTGSSWGVWAIMMPIGLPIAYQFGIPMEIMIGAVLSGGVFGDHCSPISDTTILASTAAGADHIQHVRTQLPYSLTVGICAVIGFLIGGLSGVSILGLVATAVLIVIAFFGLHKFATKKYAPIAE